jgi:hypothetical protein
MNFFTAKQTTHFKNKVFGEGELIHGETYFSYTQFAEEAVRQGFCEIINIAPMPFTDFDSGNIWKFEPLSKKILLYFAGGYGDALMLGAILPSIEKKLGIEFDICCAKEKWLEIFSPLNIKGKRVSYPPSLSALAAYDGVITDITRFYTNEGNKISPILQICRGFGLDPKELPRATYRIDDKSDDKVRLPFSSTPRIGVNLDSNGLVKSYPASLRDELLNGLKANGIDIFLVGQRRPGDPPVAEDLAFDFRDKTTITDLAALLRQMDLVIGMDSFVCHMANILDIPALVLLSTTSPEFFSCHPSVACISSRLACAPCHHAFDSCPNGNRECTAFYHDSITPSVIASAALEQLVKSFKNKILKDSKPVHEVFPSAMGPAPCADDFINHDSYEAL